MGRAREGCDDVNAQIQYAPARSLKAPTTRRRRIARVTDPSRFRNAPHPTRSVVLPLGAALVTGGLLAAVPREMPAMALATALGGAWLSMVLAMTLPTPAEYAGAELTQRMGRFRHALNAVGDTPSRADLERLLDYARTLELRDDEISEELAAIRASLDALELSARLERGDFPIVPQPGLAPGDRCHFTAPVRFGRRRADQFGHLVLTTGWLKLRGALDVGVPWTEVSAVERAGADVIVPLVNSRRLLRISCQSVSDAARGGIIAQHLLQRARAGAADATARDGRTDGSPA